MKIGPFTIKRETPQQVEHMFQSLTFNKWETYLEGENYIFTFGVDHTGDSERTVRDLKVEYSTAKLGPFCQIVIIPISEDCDVFIDTLNITDLNSIEAQFLIDVKKVAVRRDPNVEIVDDIELPTERGPGMTEYEELPSIKESTKLIENIRNSLRAARPLTNTDSDEQSGQALKASKPAPTQVPKPDGKRGGVDGLEITDPQRLRDVDAALKTRLEAKKNKTKTPRWHDLLGEKYGPDDIKAAKKRLDVLRERGIKWV